MGGNNSEEKRTCKDNNGQGVDSDHPHGHGGNGHGNNGHGPHGRFFNMRNKAMVTRSAPDFKGQAVMPDGSFKEISLADYKGKYVVLYFYPLDFTFVCPSEVIAFDRAVKDLEAKNVQLIGCSVDSHFCHWAWTQTAREKGGVGQLAHPLLSDLSKSISRSYNVLMDDNSIALRGLFLIDKEGILRHQIVNDLPLGRSVDEIHRMVDSLQFFEQNGEVCPANWKKGDKAMKPSHEGVAEYISKM